MIYKAVVSTAQGARYRVIIDGRVSAPIPRLTVVEDAGTEAPIAAGDTVAVAFFSAGLADGVVLGKVSV